MITRVSREPERPRRAHRKSGGGDRNRQLPGPRWDAHDRGEQTTGENDGIGSREIERVETDGGESERPVVSRKRGNHGGCIETLNRGHETTTDRKTGRVADFVPSRGVLMT